jgi:hypothetical protein
MLTCSIFCLWQKIPPRGVEPLSSNQQAPVDKELTQNTIPVFATSLDNLLQEYPDLAQVVKAWPGLPERTKAAVKALIQTHKADKK